MSKLRVVIREDKFIPGLGKGPFTKPVEISRNHLFNLRQQGFFVTEVSNNDLGLTPRQVKDQVPSESSLEGGAEELDRIEAVEPDEEVHEEDVQEDSDDTVEDEVPVDDEQDSDNDDLEDFTVAELKEMLDEKDIEYKHNDKKDDLIAKLKESVE